MSGRSFVILDGARAGRDAETKVLPSGQKVTEVSVATSFYAGANEYGTCWHRLKFWSDVADKASGIVKGDIVNVSGELRERSWTNQDGQKRTVHEINCDHVRFYRPKDKSSVNADSDIDF